MSIEPDAIGAIAAMHARVLLNPTADGLTAVIERAMEAAGSPMGGAVQVLLGNVSLLATRIASNAEDRADGDDQAWWAFEIEGPDGQLVDPSDSDPIITAIMRLVVAHSNGDDDDVTGLIRSLVDRGPRAVGEALSMSTQMAAATLRPEPGDDVAPPLAGTD